MIPVEYRELLALGQAEVISTSELARLRNFERRENLFNQLVGVWGSISPSTLNIEKLEALIRLRGDEDLANVFEDMTKRDKRNKLQGAREELARFLQKVIDEEEVYDDVALITNLEARIKELDAEIAGLKASK